MITIRGLFALDQMGYQPGGQKMDGKELALARKTLLAVRDWDGFQGAIRSLARILRELAVATVESKNS
jgi:hypothetical protein